LERCASRYHVKSLTKAEACPTIQVLGRGMHESPFQMAGPGGFPHFRLGLRLSSEAKMTLVLIILIILILGGGGWGYYGGGLSGPFPGVIGLLLIILLVWALMGGLPR
jgi:hypothetical protein